MNTKESFLDLRYHDCHLALNPPAFELNGHVISDFTYDKTVENQLGKILIYHSESMPQVCLKVEISSKSYRNIFRFRYHLSASEPIVMTKSEKMQNPVYFNFAAEGEKGIWREIQFSQFLPQIHSFVPVVQEIPHKQYQYGTVLPGPLVEWESPEGTILLAYEHGAEYPNHYLHFYLTENQITLQGSKGNYYNGEIISGEKEWTSCYFQVGLSRNGADELHADYRKFIFQLAPSIESRKPYIFYNTWNYQERDHDYGHQPYLSRSNLNKVLKEIETAHEIGIEVFVIDTGWYSRTGDWCVNTKSFPDELKLVKKKLDDYGMKLGLWFDPTVAAKHSHIVKTHPEYRTELNGEMECKPIWETEESYKMCLCSDYADYFADKLIALNKELGVTYFKWDGISQYGCNCAHHQHGTEQNSPQEREDCYSYQIGLQMVKIIQKLAQACPEAIVDFDITEAGRFVGLGFLSAGKYFLVNNGPYAQDFDLPKVYTYQQKTPIDMNPSTNIFFYPGSARPRNCRTGVRYDFLIPSQLFLTHYLPDGDAVSRENSLASLVLGGNGIWGDLETLTEKEKAFWKENLALYKKVREDGMKDAVITMGCTGASPEIYEKIHAETGRGLVSFFTCQKGNYTYITKELKTQPQQVIGADSWERMPNGEIKIQVNLEDKGARTVFLI